MDCSLVDEMCPFSPYECECPPLRRLVTGVRMGGQARRAAVSEAMPLNGRLNSETSQRKSRVPRASSHMRAGSR